MREAGALTRGLDDIARDLGATMLVRGGVEVVGDRLLVNVSLVTPEGQVLWSGDAQGRHDDLFTMQDQLAESLLAALRITVTEADRQRLARPPTADPQALEAYWQGLALLDRPDPDLADFDVAVAKFNGATTRDPRFSLAFAALGEAYRRRSVIINDAALMDKAEAAVREALRLDAEQPEVRLSLASVNRSTGRTAAAIDEVRRVLKTQPDNDDAHRLLGQLLAGEGLAGEALEEFRNAVSIRPRYWRNHEALGLFFYRNGRFDEAIDAFNRLADLKPNDAMPFQQLGSMYLNKGDLTRARENFEKSNQRMPNAGSFTNLGTIAYVEHRYDAAVGAYEEAIKLEPGQAGYRGNLGDAYRKLGRTKEATAAYEKAIELGEIAIGVNPNDVTTASQLGVYYAKVGKRDEAERYAKRAAKTNPTNPQVLYLRAVVLALGGDVNAAVKQLSDAIEKGYPLQLALDDDDLASLRVLPAFKALAAKKR
jgi:serine/threonine-protein kinase